MNKTKIKILLVLAMLPLLGQSCIQFNVGGGGGTDGGVYKSDNFGDTWTHNVLVRQEKKRRVTFGGADVFELAIATYDPKIIYAATRANGLMRSLDAGETWKQIVSGKGEIRAVALDPKNKNVAYASFADRIIKTIDNGENWDLIYSEPQQQLIVDIEVDGYDTKKIYGAAANGVVIKSTDGGKSWISLAAFNNRVRKLVINPKDTRIIYAGTSAIGIFKSTDGGATWDGLKGRYDNYPGAINFADLVINKNEPDKLIMASNFGLLRTDNGGAAWTPIKLLTPPDTIVLHSLAWNPARPNDIIYGTAQNIFKSTNGGQTWVSRPLPSTKIANDLVIDPSNPKTVYLGTISK